MYLVNDRGGHFVTSHKECSGVAPLKEFIPNAKSSPAMLDLEQTLKELCSFVNRLTDDKEENIQEILSRKNTDGHVQDSTCDVLHHDLHNGDSWLGQQLVIPCIPLMTWLNDF
jgi:hypothetical protein